MAKKKDAKKETTKKDAAKKGGSKKETVEVSNTSCSIKPAARKAAAKLPAVIKPMGRNAVRGRKQKSEVEIKEVVKEVEKEVVKEVEVIKEVEVVKEVEKKVVVPYICLQYLGGESDINEIVEKAKAVWQENNHSGEEFVSIDLYVKPEDNAAYYVINGTDTGKVELGL